ncbi:zinc finger protein 783-like [Hyla sarda]|uniref:zinc finger protein 783-like n=1 Tax=Hyla sarda TaxID=327740 RepID=UPI0024C33CE9|nr:zinc finger protein 783-like [Hyla sarda]
MITVRLHLSCAQALESVGISGSGRRRRDSEGSERTGPSPRVMEKHKDKRKCRSLSTMVMVTFRDVAACFQEDDWDVMEEWQREVYRSAMKEIHCALRHLGYRILNPELLVKIEKSGERSGRGSRTPPTSECAPYRPRWRRPGPGHPAENRWNRPGRREGARETVSTRVRPRQPSAET